VAGVANSVEATRQILTEFSLLEALNAQRSALDRRAGPHAAQMLAAAKKLVDSANFCGVRERPIVPRPDALTDFLQQLLGYQPIETVVVLYADIKARLICAEQIACGGPTSAEFNVRKIVLHALDRAASGVLVVHNHPSGDPRPSIPDLRMTHCLADALRPFEIKLLDHVVVAQGEAMSVLRNDWN
jgi:DNA repair protein RadC